MVATPDINYLAVLAASVVAFVVGWIYYSPGAAGKAWMKSNGVTQADMERGKEKMMKEMPKVMAIQFIATLVTAYIMAHFAAYTASTTWTDGVLLGFWIWLGFLAPGTVSLVLFDKKNWNWWVIVNGHHLINLALMGAILAVWH